MSVIVPVQADPGLLVDACGVDPSLICRLVVERTESRGLAEAADIVFARPLKIALVVIVAWVAVRVLRRVINRFVGSLAGGDPGQRLRRRLDRSSLGSTLPENLLPADTVSARAVARAETLGYVLRSVSAFSIWIMAVLTILGELGINLGP